MWSDWTSKIKHFAEDITAPDFDDEEDAEDVQDCSDGAKRSQDAKHHSLPQRLDTPAKLHTDHRSDRAIAQASFAPGSEVPALRLNNEHDALTVDHGHGSSPHPVVFAGPTPSSSPVSQPPEEAVFIQDIRAVEPLVKAPFHTGWSGDPSSLSSEKTALHRPPALSTTMTGGPSVSLPTLHDTIGDSNASPSVLLVPDGAAGLTPVPQRRSGPPLAMTTNHLDMSTPQDACTSSTSIKQSATTMAPVSSHAPPCTIAASEPVRSAAGDPPSPRAAPPMREEAVETFRDRIASLEAEKEHLLSDVLAYQEEARAVHQQTVSYYEAKLRDASVGSPELESLQQVNTLRDSLQIIAGELAAEKTLRKTAEARAGVLVCLFEELQGRLIICQAESAAWTATVAEEVTFLRSDAGRQRVRQQQQHKDELTELRLKVREQADQLLSSDTARSDLKKQLQVAQEELKKNILVSVQPPSVELGNGEEEVTSMRVKGELHALPSRRESVLEGTALAVAVAPEDVQTAVWAQKVNELTERRAALEAEVARLAEMTLSLQQHLREKASEKEEEVNRKDAAEERLREVQVKVDQLQQHAAALEDARISASEGRAAADEKAMAAELRCQAAMTELESMKQQWRNYQEEEHRRKAESVAAQSGADLSLASLSQIRKELEQRVEVYEEERQQLRRQTVDTLVRLGVVMEPAWGNGESARGGSADSQEEEEEEEEMGKRDSHDGAAARREVKPAAHDVPLLQAFHRLTQECVQQHQVVRRAERVQQEWEQTYVQARQVNDALNHQIAEAWGTIAKLREELSVKEEAMRGLQSRVSGGDAQLVEVQTQLTSSLSELQRFREECDELMERLRQTEVEEEGQRMAFSSLQEEVRSLQEQLAEKAEELRASTQTNTNLQLVLDRFQESKQHEVEVLLLESQMEAEELKKQLEAAHQMVEQDTNERARLQEVHERQLALKDAEVTTMHQKFAQMRTVLERTTSRHMDSSETSVDKQVISQLLTKYIHASLEQRREAGDILKVLSGLLDWDEASQELAGLLPGPNNPKPPGAASHGGPRRSFFGWGHREDRAPPPTGSAARPSGKRSGLASLWVEFLLKESDDAAAAAVVANTDSADFLEGDKNSASHSALTTAADAADPQPTAVLPSPGTL